MWGEWPDVQPATETINRTIENFVASIRTPYCVILVNTIIPGSKYGRDARGTTYCGISTAFFGMPSPTVVSYLTPSGTGTGTLTVVPALPAVRCVASTARKAV